MILIDIDHQSPVPLYLQVIDRLKRMMDREVLKPGDKLPPSRKLAGQLGVNRSTVIRAYEELWSQGYIESTQGSYSFVRKRMGLTSPAGIVRPGIMDWEKIANPEVNKLIKYAIDPAISKAEPSHINFRSLSPDSRILPSDVFRRAMNQVLAEEGAEILQYGDPQGYRPLREFIAGQMSRHSVTITGDEILITYGIQDALGLVMKLLIRPGDRIAVEAPTYFTAIPLFRLYGAELVCIPMNDDGMDLDRLERLLDKGNLALVYTIPNFHNPTGITTSQAHRERLLQLCVSHRTLLVEDGFVEEMKYFGKAVLPVKSMDHHHAVIYLGSFSKVLFAGLRVGWIAAEKQCIRKLTALVHSEHLGGNLLDQAALNRFCRSGYYEIHLRKIHMIYRKRMQCALRCVREYCSGEKIRFTRPVGGYLLWCTIREAGITEDQVVATLAKHGVDVVPGRHAYCDPPAHISFRVSIAHSDEKEIEEGFRRMREGFREMKLIS
jgi:DNA-binding transcriptional MocR family regulator